jgi:hypothetical protein
MTPKNRPLFSAHGKAEARRYKTWPDVVSGDPQIEEGCTLEELVNMAEEGVSEQLTDKEIKKCRSRKAHRRAGQGGKWGDDDNYVDKDPRPTRGEVLQASAILRRYVRESGDTFARQMETILGRFSRQTRLEQVNSLVETSITDFFSSATV